MEAIDSQQIFTPDFLKELLPDHISDAFFDALYGDASEGAYNIELACESAGPSQVVLLFKLVQRPGKCLVCSLTYGLPNVFSRHPLINIKGMIQKIEARGLPIKSWRLGNTIEVRADLHTIELTLDLA